MNLCDTHNDFLTELSLSEIENYAKKNCNVQICASYWSSRKEEKKIENDLTLRAHTLRQVNTQHLLHIEDMWWIKDKSTLKNLLALKPFSCSLTWNDKNELASGSRVQGGLTKWGSKCIDWLMQDKVVIDTAHLNRQSFFEIANIVKDNLYCSHTGFYGVRRHKRNLTDKQIDTIVKSDGFIGLFFYDGCIKRKQSKKFDINEIIFNLDYFISRWGYENIGFGTDFYGIENYPDGLSNYNDFVKLQLSMQNHGYTKHMIDNIFYNNFENFCKKHGC